MMADPYPRRIVIDPSMGPRLLGRGYAAEPHDKVWPVDLQWGRDFWVARWPALVDMSAPLQWGRDFWVADIHCP